MKFPYYQQYDSMDCGPTCLRMIAKHYKRDIAIEELRRKSQIGKEGVNLLGISEAAESIGFRTQPVKLSCQDLTAEATLPAIVHWNQNHFVVLYKVSKTKYYIADPGRGLLTYSQKEFESSWVGNKSRHEAEGIALLLEPSPQFYTTVADTDPQKNEGLTIRQVFNYILPYKKVIFQIFIGLGITSLLQLFVPFLTQSVIDIGINSSNLSFLYIVLSAQLAIMAGRLIVEFIRSWLLLYVSSRINISILTDFLIKLMKLPVSFFDSKKTGDILQRMNDHQRIESFLTGPSINILFSLVSLTIFLFILAYFNIGIFIVFVGASFVSTLWAILFLKRRKMLDYKKFEISAHEQAATIQMVLGMQEIKLVGAEKNMRWNWERLRAKLFNLNMKVLSLSQWQQSGAAFINEGKNIFITFLSCKAVIDHEMTLGTMLATQYIVGQLNSPVSQMISFMQSWQNAKISMDWLNEIHGLEDEEPAHKNLLKELPADLSKYIYGGGTAHTNITASYTTKAPDGQDAIVIPSKSYASLNSQLSRKRKDPSICIEDLCFTYPGAGNEPILQNINLEIPFGKKTAIVGTSGSGKTTLLKLLLKFYTPQSGSISLGKTPLLNISHRVWRKNCGVVMQESFIFSDTIAKNIAIEMDDFDLQRLYDAAETANILQFIQDLPLGFNTKIGAEGMGISMGQRQRILIARAVYRNPSFIFLDEATNSLDANNESVIVNNLHSFLENRTVIIVAHRLSTVKYADQIVVLNKGTITEKGTHQELIKLRGEYYTLVKNQLELGQ